MSGTVLVADDSPTIQRRASGILTGEGLDVLTVANGVAAIKKLSTIEPILVLADVSMPGRDGYEVCQLIKQSPETKHIPVLLVFSDLEPYDQARGAQVGADGCIRKPFEHDELVGLVRRFTEQSQTAAPAPSPVAAPSAPELEPLGGEQDLEPQPEPEISAVPEGIAFAADAPVAEVETHQAVVEAADVVAEPEPGISPEPAISAEAFPGVGEGAAVPSGHSEPELVEELQGPVEEHHEHPHEHAAIFQAPEEIPEPIFTDELEPSATMEASANEVVPEASEAMSEPSSDVSERAVAEPAPAEQPQAAYEDFRSTEEDFRRAAEPVSPVTQEPEPEMFPPVQDEMQSPEPPAEPAAEMPPAPSLSREQVYKIVHETVLRMSPPALSHSAIEELADRLTEEIISSGIV